MAREKRSKGKRVWLSSDTARLLEVVSVKHGFDADGDESAVIAMALTALIIGQPSQQRSVSAEPSLAPDDDDAIEEDEGALDMTLDDFLNA